VLEVNASSYKKIIILQDILKPTVTVSKTVAPNSVD